MPLIVPGVVNVTIKGRHLGNKCYNTLSFAVNETISKTRQDCIAKLRSQVVNSWEDDVLPQLSNRYTFEGIETVDVNEAGGRVWDDSSGKTGVLTAEPLPSTVCVRVMKDAERRAGLRRGSLFIGGLVEAHTVGNQMYAEARANMQAAMDAFYNEVEDSGTTSDWSYWPITVHRVGDEVSISAIEGFSVQTSVSHQDRRMRVR